LASRERPSVATGEPHRGGRRAPSAAPCHRQSMHITTKPPDVACRPAGRRHGVVECAREGHLWRPTVIDTENHRIERERKRSRIAVVGVEAAGDPSPTMEEYH